MNNHIHNLFVAFLLIVLGHEVSAQRFGHSQTGSLDTVRVKADRFIFIDDNAYYVKNDTVFILPDSVEFHVKKNNMDRTDSFYLKVEQKMSKRKVSSLVYDLLFNSTSSNKPHTEESSEQRFTPFENETIDNIEYQHLNVFGSSINDTTINKETKWTRPFNRSHIHTRKWVVRKNLMFKEKDDISPDAMVDSERLLRRLDYIKDARIFIDDTNRGNIADVVVATKDVFPYNFLWSPNNGNNALFGISNINIAGIGHELEYDYIPDGDTDIEKGGSEYFYRVRNIEKTFIDGEINYSKHFRKTGKGLFINRQFLTQETKYAGGVAFSRYDHGEFNYDPIADTAIAFIFGLKYRDFWVARAFNTSIVSNFIGFGENTKAVAAVRIEKYDYLSRPTVSADTNYRFYNITNYLFSLGLTSRTYAKDRFILQYGRTEDIPTGSALWAVLGHQSGEFNNRKYLGINYARGGYLEGFGYLNTIYSLGSFISKNGFEDGLLKIGVDYYTKLFTLNQFKFRQFVDITFAQSIDPSEEPLITSHNDLGIRGLSSIFLRTTTKFNVKFESLLFTPVNILGFRLALFSFLDYTSVGNHKSDFFRSESYLGMGGGIRLRNDNLAISTIQLRFGYYPKTPTNATHDLIDVATSANINIRDFFFTAPEVLGFN